MKKILILFLLLTISLFGQFASHENGFMLHGTYYSYTEEKEITCYIALYMNAPVRLVITVDTDTQPSWLNINKFYQFLEEDDPNVMYADEFGYIITIYDSEHNNKYIKDILLQIVDNILIIYCEDDTSCYFDFTEYKKDIIKNKSYKKIMQ